MRGTKAGFVGMAPCGPFFSLLPTNLLQQRVQHHHHHHRDHPQQPNNNNSQRGEACGSKLRQSSSGLLNGAGGTPAFLHARTAPGKKFNLSDLDDLDSESTSTSSSSSSSSDSDSTSTSVRERRRCKRFQEQLDLQERRKRQILFQQQQQQHVVTVSPKSVLKILIDFGDMEIAIRKKKSALVCPDDSSSVSSLSAYDEFESSSEESIDYD